MSMNFCPILTSVGIEIEFANVPMETIKRSRRIRDNWKIVRDGTCSRTKIMLPNNEEIVFSERFNADSAALFGLKTQYVGGEFVSPIFNIEKPKWFDNVLYVIDALKEFEEGIDLRTGIHIHVNIQTPPLYALHNLVKLGLGLEAPMYRLSCGELGFHRGSKLKDYMYCRPLSSPGPQVIQDSKRKWRPVFDAKKLLSTQSLHEFFIACGRLDINGRNKWHQSRYTWLNFASILLHKTIEWRIFNSTLEHENILAWVELCSHLVSHSLGKNIELPEFPLGNSQILENNEYSFNDFLTYACITDDDLSKKLEHLWYLGDWQENVKGYQKGHLGHSLDLGGIEKDTIERLFAEPINPDDMTVVEESSIEEELERVEGSRAQPIRATIEENGEEVEGTLEQREPQSREYITFRNVTRQPIRYNSLEHW